VAQLCKTLWATTGVGTVFIQLSRPLMLRSPLVTCCWGDSNCSTGCAAAQRTPTADPDPHAGMPLQKFGTPSAHRNSYFQLQQQAEQQLHPQQTNCLRAYYQQQWMYPVTVCFSCPPPKTPQSLNTHCFRIITLHYTHHTYVDTPPPPPQTQHSPFTHTHRTGTCCPAHIMSPCPSCTCRTSSSILQSCQQPSGNKQNYHTYHTHSRPPPHSVLLSSCCQTCTALLVLGVFVTREHVRHNKSGITHRDRAKINHLRELPYQVNHFAAVGRSPFRIALFVLPNLPAEREEAHCHHISRRAGGRGSRPQCTKAAVNNRGSRRPPTPRHIHSNSRVRYRPCRGTQPCRRQYKQQQQYRQYRRQQRHRQRRYGCGWGHCQH
jgi:hypothetical protein